MSVSYVDPLWTTRCLVVSTGRAATHTATHAATLTARPESKAKAKAKTTLYVTVHSVGRVVESSREEQQRQSSGSTRAPLAIRSTLFSSVSLALSLLFSSLLFSSRSFPLRQLEEMQIFPREISRGKCFFSFFFLSSEIGLELAFAGTQAQAKAKA